MQVILTREKEDNKKLKALLDAELIEFPCIEFTEPEDTYAKLDTAIRKNHEYDWFFFLSQKAAESFFNRLIDIGGNLFNLAPHIKIACVGAKTKDFIENTINFPVNFIPSEFNSECFIEEFLTKHGRSAKQILLPRTNVQDDFVTKLEAAHITVHQVGAYSTKIPECPASITDIQSAYQAGEELALIFTSPEIFRNFVKLIPELELNSKQIKIFSIGPRTTKTIKELNPKIKVIETAKSTIEDLASTIQQEL